MYVCLFVVSRVQQGSTPSKSSAASDVYNIIILLTVASLAGIVVFGNVTDYNSNFQFVSHVMSMDTKPDLFR